LMRAGGEPQAVLTKHVHSLCLPHEALRLSEPMTDGSHNPESPGDRGNWPEARPGAKQKRMQPQTDEPPKGNPHPSGWGGGQMRYCAGVGRLSALALKLALIGLMASAPLVAAKVFMSVVWEPYAVVLCAEMLAQSSRLFVKLCFFSIYVSSFAALAALAIGRASYTLWALMTYFYLFENISPFQRWTLLNAPYIYFSLASPATSLTEVLLLFPVNTLALPFALSALFTLYSRGEVKWR